MDLWILTIKHHPFVINGDTYFKKLSEVEDYIGENDIQLDHIIKIDRNRGGKITTYEVIDLLPIRSLRVVQLNSWHSRIR